MMNSAPSKHGSFRCSFGVLFIAPFGLIAVATAYPHGLLVFLLLAFSVLALLAAFWVDVMLATISRKRGALQWSLKQMLFAITSLAVILSILADPWPYRLRFAISRAALERLAVRAERGESLIQPERAGLFWIVKMDRRQNRCPYTEPIAAMGSQKVADPLYTCLWTGPESGFVHPAPKNRSLFNDYAPDCFDDDWQFFIED